MITETENNQKQLSEKSKPDNCQCFLKGLAIVYYITVLPFENKVPMCLDDYSLNYYQENQLVKI